MALREPFVNELETNVAKMNAAASDFISEASPPRQKRVTSGYYSSDVAHLSSGEVNEEIQRVKAESAEIKRQLAQLSRSNEPSSSESVGFVDGTKSQWFRNVTTRDARRLRRSPPAVCSPSASLVRHHISESAPATSTVRQPTVVRQPTQSTTTSSARHQRDCRVSPSSSTGSVHQQYVVSDQRQLIRRQLYDDAVVSEFDEGRDVVLSSVHVQDEKCSSVAEDSETKSKFSFKSKRDKAVSVCNSRVNEGSRLRKPRCSNSDSECSSSAKSVVSVSENVDKRAITRAVVSGDSVKKSSVCKAKSKSDYYAAKSSSDTECSDSEDSVNRTDKRSVARNEKLKSLKSKSVCSKRGVSDRKRSVCVSKAAKSSSDTECSDSEDSVKRTDKRYVARNKK